MDKEEARRKIKEIEQFYKSAFCIDGNVEILHNNKDFKISAVLKLTDSKRGIFYIGTLEKNK